MNRRRLGDFTATKVHSSTGAKTWDPVWGYFKALEPGHMMQACIPHDLGMD